VCGFVALCLQTYAWHVAWDGIKQAIDSHACKQLASIVTILVSSLTLEFVIVPDRPHSVVQDLEVACSCPRPNLCLPAALPCPCPQHCYAQSAEAAEEAGCLAAGAA
jgi:hypothetical protein